MIELGIDDAERWSLVAAAVGTAIVGLETLASPVEYADGGLLSGEFAQLQWPASSSVMSFALALLADAKFFLWCNVGQVLLSVAGIIQGLDGGPILPILPVGLLLLSIMRLLRTPYGGDGADQMLLLVLAGLSAGALFHDSEHGRKAAAWFIGAQLVLSYFVAGIAKLGGPTWRNGSGLVAVLGTTAYGVPGLRRLLISAPGRGIAFIASWIVIVFEVTFPLTLVIPGKFVLAYFSMGLLFHLSVAIVMGLNTFLPAFLAAYPPAIVCLLTNSR